MGKIILPEEILDLDTIKADFTDINCTHPAGHCYGSDGGSGIPENLKVPEGQGGNKEVWELNITKTKIITKAIYSKCQYCGKYIYAGEKTEEIKEA